jgi:hypothetical protein
LSVDPTRFEGSDVPFGLLCPIVPVPRVVTTGKLHDYERMTAELKRLERENPGDVKLRSFGRSVEGREIWVVEIGRGPKNLFVSCRMHADELMGTESMLDYIGRLAPSREKEHSRMKEECTLVVAPMVNVDAADFYVKSKALTGGMRPPNELVDMWMESSREDSIYDLYIQMFMRLNWTYSNHYSSVFKMVTRSTDPVTGLAEYECNLEDWIWIDDAGEFPHIYNSNRDSWQLTHPENRALREALMAYRPKWYVDLHGSQGAVLSKRLREIREEAHDWELHGRKLPWAGYSAATVNPQYYATDPDAAIKGVPLGTRFADPRYLRFSGLPDTKKSMRGYLHPSATKWEMDEALKIQKIALTAMEAENGISMEPIGWLQWRGAGANPCTARQAASCVPEFECASILIENWAGAGGPYGDHMLDETLMYMESAVDSVLKYAAGMVQPEGWEDFPVLQGPHDVWTKGEFRKRKAGVDPEFYEAFFPHLM